DADRLADPLARGPLQDVRVAAVARLDQDLKRVQLLRLAVDDELVVARQPLDGEQDRLDLAWKNVAAVEHEQVVRAPADLADAASRVAAAARLAHEHAAVASPVA